MRSKPDSLRHSNSIVADSRNRRTPGDSAARNKHGTSFARLGEENLRTDEAEKIDHGAERTGFFVVLENPFQAQHGVPRTMEIEVCFAGSYWLRSFAARSSSRRICGSVAVAQRA